MPVRKMLDLRTGEVSEIHQMCRAERTIDSSTMMRADGQHHISPAGHSASPNASMLCLG